MIFIAASKSPQYDCSDAYSGSYLAFDFALPPNPSRSYTSVSFCLFFLLPFFLFSFFFLFFESSPPSNLDPEIATIISYDSFDPQPFMFIVLPVALFQFLPRLFFSCTITDRRRAITRVHPPLIVRVPTENSRSS